jgi:lysophospholipase L1-like esterase
MMGQDPAVWIGISASDTLKASYADPSNADVPLESSVNIADNQWHHVRLVFSSSGSILFLDGVSVASNVKLLGSGAYNSFFRVRCFGVGAPQYNWGGEIDEMAVWSIAKSTANFTPATSPYVGTETGLVALYRFNNNLVDSKGIVAAAPSQVTLTLGASTGAVGVPVSFTVGTDQLLASGQPQAVSMTASVAGSFSQTNFTLSDSVPTATGTFTPSAAGTATFTASATGTPTLTAGSASYTVTATANNALTNATSKVLWSPGNWSVGASSAKTICPGAYFKTKFTGTACTLQFDMTGILTPLPQICYQVDGIGAWVTVSLAASVAIAVPSLTADYANKGGHFLEVVFKSATQAQSRWSPQAAALSLTGIVLDAGGTLTKPPGLPSDIWFYGDSITEGYFSVNGTATNECDRNDARQSWARIAAQNLGMEFGIIAFGGASMNNTGPGGIPALPLSYQYQYSGVARSFASAPAAIVTMMGTNDSGDITSAMTTFLNGLIAATPSTTKIIVIRQFNGTSHEAQTQAAIAATTTPARVSYVSSAGWYNSANSYDTSHPYGPENINIGYSAAAAIRPILAGSAPLASRTVTMALRGSDGALAANLIGVQVSVVDNPLRPAGEVVRYQTTTGTTNSAGVLSFTYQSTLAAGGTCGVDIVMPVDKRNMAVSVVVA